MKVYLYLLRRDKKGLRILANFPTDQEVLATRVLNIKSMNLPKKTESQILSVTESNKMMWELWMESSNSYKDLKDALRKRGCDKLPITAMPEFLIESPIKIANIAEKPKVMLRKSCDNKPVLRRNSR